VALSPLDRAALKGMASEACCSAGAPIAAEYAGNGTVSTIGEDLAIYEVGTGPRLIVFVYDIFGFGAPPNNGTVRRVCDHFAESGFRVIMPDFYRGKPWTLDKFPPTTDELKAEFGAWWGSTAAYDVVKADITNTVLPYAASSGAESFAVAGTCWGGLMSCTLAGDCEGLALPLVGAAAVHGARLTAEHGTNSAVPLCLLPSGEDPPVDDIMAELASKPFADKCVSQFYADEVHGFLAARGNWGDEARGAAAHDALGRLVAFFASVF